MPFRGEKIDNNLRRDSSLEKLAKLKPSFDRSGKGTLTAGNSTPLTDGASAALLASEDWAAAHGFEPQAFLTYGKFAAVDFIASEEAPFDPGELSVAVAPPAIANALHAATRLRFRQLPLLSEGL